MKRCGLFQGAELVAKGGGTNSLKSLKKCLFGKPAQMVFEMDVKDVQDDRFELEFHYCPLVKAWQKLGCTDEEISNLCDSAMCGDRGIGSSHAATSTCSRPSPAANTARHFRSTTAKKAAAGSLGLRRGNRL